MPLQAQVTYDSLNSSSKALQFKGTNSGDFSLHFSPESVPVAGYWHGNAGITLFVPTFPLKEGHVYYLKKDDKLVRRISLPVVRHSPPRVVRIYPDVDTIPANLLKIYVLFDQPMAAGHAADQIRLIDLNTGKEEPEAFLQLEQELWSYSNDTLTLWFDPGRIKRDLIPNEELGNPLTEGKEYLLEVYPGWPGQNGTPTIATTSRKFYVTEADRTRPSTEDWQVTTPAVGTTGALFLRFPEAMDMGAVTSSLRLTCEDTEVPYRLEWLQGDKGLLMHPERPWQEGGCKLHIDAKAEDLAGNNLNRLFDQDVEEATGEQEEYVIEFEIAAEGE